DDDAGGRLDAWARRCRVRMESAAILDRAFAHPTARRRGDRMNRRRVVTLLGGAAAAWSFPAQGQQSERMRRVGALIGLPGNDAETRSWLAGFEKTLERLGWIGGRNVQIEYRYAPAARRVQELAKEVVATQPDVILSYSTPASAALQRETRAIPVVF